MRFSQQTVRNLYTPFILLLFLFFANVGNAQIDCEKYITSYSIVQDVCNPRLVHFKNLNPGEEIEWDFGDGTKGNKNEEAHEYQSDGEFLVYMRVRYLGNCIGEVTKRIPVYLAEDPQLISTANTTICPGNSVPLTTKNIPADYAICWLPTEGLSDPQSRNPIAQPTVTTTYRYQTRYVGENLVKNPGFENGYADFYSQYEITEVQHKFEGAYWVTNNPNNLNEDFSTCGDHTSGTGKMMVVNGSYKTGEIVWSQKIENVEPNTVYSFGVWIQSVNYPHPSKLLFRINGKVLGDNVNAGDNPCEWSEFSTLWNSEGATDALIEIINNNTIQGGNDFALDDISFFTQSIKYDEVTITVAPEADIQVSDDAVICEGEKKQLVATGGASYTWSPTEGLSNTSIANPEASPSQTTTYKVTGTTDAGCTGEAEVTVTVNPKPVIDLPASADICINNPYQVEANVQGAATYSWTPAAGLSDATIPNPIVNPSATTTYTLKAISDQQCEAEKSIVVNVATSIDVNVSGDVTICNGQSTQLTASGATTYSWQPVEGLSDPTIANPIAAPTSTTTYTVTGTSELGCIGTAVVTVTVNDQPTIDLGPDAAYCAGGSYPIPGIAENATSITWSPAAGLSDATIANPLVNPTQTTTYKVTATNGQCIAEDEITITVAPALQISTINDQTVCGPTEIELTTTAVSGATYEWSPATGLSDPTVASPIADVKETTTYTVKVTTPDGCEGTTSVTITVNDQPTIDLGPDAAYCAGGSYPIPGIAENATSITWSPAAGLSDATIANPLANPTQTTTYKVTATNGQCTAEDEITITVAPALQISTINDQTVCGPTEIELTTTAVSGATYEWSPATGLSDPAVASPTADVKETTTYTVKVTTADGCEGTASVTITVNDQPTIDLGPDAAYCAGGSYQIPGVAENATSITWSPAAGLSDATIANPLANPTQTTTYKVTATNGQCIAEDEITISVAEALQISTINDVTVCGPTELELTTTAVSGATYEWSPATGLSDPAVASPTADVKETTTYTVKVTTPDGCEGTASVTITVNDQPTIDLGPDAAYCAGGSYQIPVVAENATSITWSPAAGLSDATIANPIANPTQTTTYKVTATNGQCIAEDEITISVAETLTINTIKDTTLCGAGTLELTTTSVSGATYQWSPATGLSDPAVASPTANVKETTTYTVKVTTADGCEGTASVTITVNDQPTIDLGPDAAYCAGGSYQIPGVAENATSISWSPTAGLSDATIANPIANPTQTTTYKVTATNGQCIAEDEITISVAETLTINTIKDTTLCGAGTLELTTTSVSGATYQWSPATGLSDPAVASPTADVKETTTYTVKVTTADGCEGTASVTITVNDQPTIDLGPDAAYCAGGSYQIPGVATNATNITWSPSTGLSDATIANPLANPTQTTTYKVTATNGQCIAEDEITISVSDNLTLNTINDTTICGPASLELTTTNVPGATYEWSPAAGLSNTTIANPVANVSKTTTYTVKATTPAGCSGTASVTITVNDQPTVHVGNDASFCIGGSYQIPGVASNASKISWTPASGLSNSSIANPVASPTTTTTYVVKAENGKCIARDTITIHISTSIQVTPINDTSVCAGSKVPLTGTVIPGATYSWSPATGLSDATISNPWASPATTTNYVLTVTSPDGCVGKDSVLVTVSPNPEITFNTPAKVCMGESFQLEAISIGAKQFQWSPAQGLSDPRIGRPVATMNGTTRYAVTVTNTSGCTSTDSVMVTAAPLPDVDIVKPNDIDCAHSEVQLAVSGGATYQWSPSVGLDNPASNRPIAKPSETTTYIVTATTADGCKATADVTVNVKAIPTEELHIPSAFTPNGDGRNDCFGLRSSNITSPFQFEVYNRWGQKVFMTNSTDNCWDGTFKGVNQPGDAYVWQIKVNGECGIIYKKGTVVLVR